MIGTTIGRYRVVEKLGEGGGGSVWRAEDPVLGRSVAIKLLPGHVADSPEAKERLLRKARAACNLHHAGIATVYEAGEDDGRLYLAFEHVDGETVAQRVKREGLLPVEEAIRIARQAAAALAHAHDNGILHRDVTAGNLMLDRQGAVKLVDFGLTLPEEPSRRTRDTTHATPGTIGYIAPEIVKGERDDRRADLYGLGVVLYEMLTGHLPFERDRAEAVLFAVVNEEPVPPRKHRPDLPPDLETIVLRAIAKEAADRFADASDLRRALGGDSPVRTVASGSRNRRRIPRNALVASAVAVAGFAAWKIFAPDPAPHFHSVAVLPLSLPGENAEEIAYLATGLGDVVAGRLACVSDLRVTPWVTSRRYPPEAMPIQDIGAELNVESLVVGELVEESGTLSVELSLLAVADGERIWSATFEESRLGMLDLQDVVTLAIAHGIRVRISPEEETCLTRGATDHAEAWDQYLRGVAALQAYTPEARDAALAHFETALAMDPRLAEAWIGVGAIQAARYDQGWTVGSPILAEEAFQRALEIDPTSVAAVRGLMRANFYLNNDECIRLAREIRDSGRLTVETLLAQAEGLTLGGLCDEAVPLFQTVLQLDPANRPARWFIIVALHWSGDNEEAIEAGGEFMRLFGEDPEVRLWIADAHLCLGHPEDALLHYGRSLEIQGGDAYSFLYAYAAEAMRSVGAEERARDLAETAVPRLEARLGGGRSSRIETDIMRLCAIAADTAGVLDHGMRLLETGDAWRLNLDCPTIAVAFARVGEERLANHVLEQITERIRSAHRSRDAGGDPASARLPVRPNWLKACSVDRMSLSSVSHLPAYDDWKLALSEELDRRRALYGEE